MNRLTFVDRIEEHIIKNFSLMYPSTSELVVNHKYIGDSEIIFGLSDGSKIIYDECSNGITFIKHSDDADKAELSEQELRKEFARKLKKKLRLRGVTQKELAHAIGMSEFAISHYASGKRTPSVYAVNKIARFFNCDVSDLTDFDYLL